MLAKTLICLNIFTALGVGVILAGELAPSEWDHEVAKRPLHHSQFGEITHFKSDAEVARLLEQGRIEDESFRAHEALMNPPGECDDDNCFDDKRIDPKEWKTFVHNQWPKVINRIPVAENNTFDTSGYTTYRRHVSDY